MAQRPATPEGFAGNAEAGPSTPRSSYRTPPETPSRTPQSTKRRSWFGFGGFSSSTTPSKQTDQSPRRSSFDPALELTERFGLGPLDARRTGDIGRDEEEEEVLTIDGEPIGSQTTTPKKKKQSARDHGEALPMHDLKGKTRRSSRQDMRISVDSPRAETILLRGQLSPSSPLNLLPKRPALSPRGSSMQADLPVPSRASLEKSTPPLPIDRPLPALPPDPGTITVSEDETRPSLPLPSDSTYTLTPPSDIIITPSSPRRAEFGDARKDDKPSKRPSTHFEDALGRRRAVTDSVPNSRSSSRSRKTVSRKSSMIGLGMPRSLRDSDGAVSEKGNGNVGDPPLPAKPISVSSPHPSRPSSPTPRLAFLEPEGENRGRQRDNIVKHKRSRSLSGIFNRSAEQLVVPPAPIEQEEATRKLAEEPSKDHAGGKMSGMLSWLGVKKGKRRTAESQVDPPQQIDKEISTNGEATSSSITIMPHRTPSTMSPPVSTSTTLPAIPIPARQPSSTSGLPSSGASPHSVSFAPSPMYVSRQSSWVATPAREEEEIIFSPPSAPWVDGLDSPAGGMSPSGTSPISTLPEIMEGVPSPAADSLRESRQRGMPATASSGDIASLRSPVVADGRHRAWSDAPHPSPSLAPGSTGSSHAPSAYSPNGRPSMGPRSNSGNSAIIDRMKGVFAKSTSSRSRSKSLLPESSIAHPDADVNEFGGLSFRPKSMSTKGRPSTAGSAHSTFSATRARVPNAALLDMHGADKRIFMDESPAGGRSARNSFSAVSGTTASTTASAASGSGSVFNPRPAPASVAGSHSINGASTPSSASTPAAMSDATRSPTGRGSMDANAPPQASSKTRVRASTVSFAPTATATASTIPVSPFLRALGATPPRRRPSAISRISGGRLGSTPSSPKPSGSLFPLPPRSSASTAASVPALSADDAPSGGEMSTILLSPGTSPRPSTTSLTGQSSEIIKAVSKVEEGQTVQDWLERVRQFVGSADIAGVLASSADAFHAEALQLYMAQFDFTHQALDIALRRLLLKMSLPKETQQIDRVIEAFAQRYEACEPGLFGSKDNTYVLAFSMMMLHTDAFNKHNKNKMTKADYVRNTRLEGLSNTVLEAFYDNITFTPFVYQDDQDPLLTPNTASLLNGNRSRSGSETGYPFPTTPISTHSVPTSLSSSTPKTVHLAGQRTDVYSLLKHNLDDLASLRVDVESHVPATSPFSCLGTRDALNAEGLHDRFITAGILRIDASPKKRPTHMKHDKDKKDETVIRVTKVGLLSRRDDAIDRRSSKKWKSWSVILTGSQLLFFKDPFWAANLLEVTRTTKRNDRGHLVLPAMGSFVPDEVFPVKDAVAVYDSGLPILPHRQYLMTAADADEMNDWISLINYAAAFKTAGLRMRGGQMEREQAVLAGAAAASSFKREIGQLAPHGPMTRTPPRKAVFGRPASPTLSARQMPPPSSIGMIKARSAPIDGLPNSQSSKSWVFVDGATTQKRTSIEQEIQKVADGITVLETGPTTRPSMEATVETKAGLINPDVDGGEQIVKDDGERLEEVFDIVKAELAQGGNEAARQVVALAGKETKLVSPGSRRRHGSRAADIEKHLQQYQDCLESASSQLASHIDQARNLAILTPFQRSTRERISAIVPPLSHRIRSDRLQVAKWSIYLSILARDAERDERDFARIRHVAIQAAAKSLKDPKGVKGVLEDEKALDEALKGNAVPMLALPSDDAPTVETDPTQVVQTVFDSATPNAPFANRSSISGDEHDAGYISDAHSLFSGSGGKELPVLFRKGSEEVAPGQMDQNGRDSPFARPAFGRAGSANSVASSTGSFFGSKVGGEGMKRQGSNLLAPPA